MTSELFKKNALTFTSLTKQGICNTDAAERLVINDTSPLFFATIIFNRLAIASTTDQYHQKLHVIQVSEFQIFFWPKIFNRISCFGVSCDYKKQNSKMPYCLSYQFEYFGHPSFETWPAKNSFYILHSEHDSILSANGPECNIEP